MKLIIAEKPLLGKAFVDAIPGRILDSADAVVTKEWRGETIKIIWCFGHMLTLKDPEDYDPKYKEWNLADLPIYFPGWEKKVDPEKTDRAKQIEQLLKEADTVIHAGDNDDEGQNIVDELLDFYHYRGPVKRVDVRDISPDILLHSLENMTDNALHRMDGVAAYARQICDKMFGYNLSRYYTLINGVRVTIGRVQTPALGLVVRRDQLIEGHSKQLFFNLHAKVDIEGKTVAVKFRPGKDNPNLEEGLILDKSYVEGLARDLVGKTLSPCTVKHSTSKEAPPLPFNSTKLNSYCGARWDMSPAQVLKTTQQLRDKYKAISYNRSECRYLSMELHRAAPRTIRCAAKNLGIDASAFDPSIQSKAFDDSKIGAHMGIIPTAIEVDTSQFSKSEKNVYEAICLYYLAQFLPPAEKAITKLVIDVPGGTLTASTSQYTSLGYRTLFKDDALQSESEGAESDESQEEDSKSDELSTIPDGQYSGKVLSTNIKEGETKPPTRYTQSTLEEDMTRIARYCKNEKVKQLLLLKDSSKTGENGSVGTAATRPAIILGLIKHGLLKEVKKGRKTYVESTPLGRALYNMLPDNIRGVDVTAKWWCLTEDIKLGKYTVDKMAENVLLTVNAVISSGAGKIEAAGDLAKGVTGPRLGKCPVCGGDVYETNRGYQCLNDSCKFIFWKDNRLFASIGKKLTPKAVTMFLEKGRIGLKNCKSAKTGRTFDTIIVVDFSSGQPNFSFASADSSDPIGRCPKCGGNVMEKGPRYICESEHCDFVLWKSNNLLTAIGKKLSNDEAASLLQNGRTKLKGCKSKKKPGKTYSCILVADFGVAPVEFKVEFTK